MNVTEVALGYLKAGVCVIPVKLDGSKSPDIAKLKPFFTQTPTPWLVRKWFSRRAGIGVVCGAVSHGLEILDFDQWETFEPWRSIVPESIFLKLAVVETGSGGYHVYYRCRQVAGNKKIAMWEQADCVSHKQADTRHGCDGKSIKPTRIETRGEGGYVVAPGSPLAVHSTGQPYAQILGPPLPQINTLTPEERRELWLAAATFDCHPKKSEKIELAKRKIKAGRFALQNLTLPGASSTPWDDFDRHGSWDDILIPHDWTKATPNHWTRPDKTKGTSASVGSNAEGVEILTVFSSNAHPLSPGSYGKFRAYAILEHGGNGREAGKALAKLGYGQILNKEAA